MSKKQPLFNVELSIKGHRVIAKINADSVDDAKIKMLEVHSNAEVIQAYPALPDNVVNKKKSRW